MSHFILVELVNNGKKESKSFKWQPSNIISYSNDESENSVSIDWESEYNGFVARIEKEFGISITNNNNVKIVGITEDGDDSDEAFNRKDSLESLWFDVQGKYEESQNSDDDGENDDDIKNDSKAEESKEIFMRVEVRVGNSNDINDNKNKEASHQDNKVNANDSDKDDEIVKMNLSGPCPVESDRDEEDSISESGKNLLKHLKELENKNEDEDNHEADVSVDTRHITKLNEKENEAQGINNKILTPELKLSTIGLKLSELQSEMLNSGSDIADSPEMVIGESNMIKEIRSLLEAIRQCLDRDDRQQKEFLDYFPQTLADLSVKRGWYVTHVRIIHVEFAV